MSICSLYEISAGFPSSAEDYIEQNLDLNELLVTHPAATFFVRVKGESMRDAGIYSDDILIVDRSIHAQNNHIIVALLDGEFTVKRLKKRGEKISLVADNPRFPPIEREFQVWGVVTYVIHRAR